MKKWNLKQVISLFVLLVVLCVNTNLTVYAAKDKYYIKVNKATNVVTVYTTEDDEPYTAFTCSAGHDTPLGTFHTMNKYTWRELMGPSFGQYSTRITGSILFHSVWYYQIDKRTQSYAQYNKLGTLASHGCIRLTVAASKWIYDNCPLGTKVIIFNGTSKDDPLGKPPTIKVKTSQYMGWDPTDPDENNPYKTKNTIPKITVSNEKLQIGTKFKDQMTCVDSAGNDITSWVKKTGSVKMKRLGDYKVTYSVVDSFGRSAKKSVIYSVIDKNKCTISGITKDRDFVSGDAINLLEKVKAKDGAGKNITDLIKVYVQKPSEMKYRLVENPELIFDEIGEYDIRYEVVNPNNKKKTKKYIVLTVQEKLEDVEGTEESVDTENMVETDKSESEEETGELIYE